MKDKVPEYRSNPRRVTAPRVFTDGDLEVQLAPAVSQLQEMCEHSFEQAMIIQSLEGNNEQLCNINCALRNKLKKSHDVLKQFQKNKSRALKARAKRAIKRNANTFHRSTAWRRLTRARAILMERNLDLREVCVSYCRGLSMSEVHTLLKDSNHVNQGTIMHCELSKHFKNVAGFIKSNICLSDGKWNTPRRFCSFSFNPSTGMYQPLLFHEPQLLPRSEN